MKSTKNKLAIETDISSPFGRYKFRGYKKMLYSFAQKLPKNTFSFKIALAMRKLTLQNRIKIVDAKQFDLMLRLYPMDNLGDRFLLFLPKFFEYDEFLLMSKFLKPDSTFIDIGANMCMYSLIAAKYINQSGRILAFEPNPIMIDRSMFNLEINKCQKLVELYQIGIADKESSFNLALSYKNLGGASLVDDCGDDMTMVKCRPLLDVLKEQNIQQIDLLKIDIEKAEPLALNPFFEKAPKSLFPKMIFIESDSNINLLNLGYKFVTKTRSNNSIYKLV